MFLWILTFLISTSTMAEISFEGKSFDDVAMELNKKHNVLYKTTYELKDKIDQYIVLDARDQKEFNVSHIKNAIHVGFKDFDYKSIRPMLTPNKEIVVYCSIGYRSAVVAQKLMDKGHKAFNFYGGIFDWFNRGNPIVDNENKLTERIHGYNKKWSVWVKRGEVVLK